MTYIQYCMCIHIFVIFSSLKSRVAIYVFIGELQAKNRDHHMAKTNVENVRGHSKSEVTIRWGLELRKGKNCSQASAPKGGSGKGGRFPQTDNARFDAFCNCASRFNFAD